MSAFRLIEAQKATHTVPKLCRMLGVSRSGYYAWRRRSPSERARFDAVLTEKIETIHRRDDPSQQPGNVRFTESTRRACCHRHPLLQETCSQAHASAEAARLPTRPEDKDHLPRRPPTRCCSRPGRQELRSSRARQAVGGRHHLITYIRSGEGFLYLAFILDVCSRKVVGWSMARHLRTDRACGGCPRDGDRKEETLSRARASFGSGRAVHGSVLRPAPGGGRHRTLDGKRRLCLRERPRRELRGNSEERASLPGKVAHPPGCQDGFSAEYIEGFYNTRRRHSALGQISPAEFEEVRLRDEDVA